MAMLIGYWGGQELHHEEAEELAQFPGKEMTSARWEPKLVTQSR